MSITRRSSFQATIQRVYDFIHDDARATQHKLHTRLNIVNQAFEKFQKEHFDIIIQPEIKDVENVFNEHTSLYESVEEMMIKTNARLWLIEREARIDQQQVAILNQITQLDDRAMDIAREEGIIEAMNEQAKHDKDDISREKAELEEQKTNMRTNEKRLCDLAYALRIQGDTLMVTQEQYENERREYQVRMSERERALDEFEQQLTEKALRLQLAQGGNKPPIISPVIELELPRFSGQFNEIVAWNQLYEKTVHNVDMLSTPSSNNNSAFG